MSEKIYLNLLILGAILSQGILATFLEDDDEVSSKLLSRKKRVITNVPENRIPTVPELFYIVKVLHQMLYICNGIIVSPKHILTARLCSEKAAVPMELQIETGDIHMGPIFFGAHYVSHIIKEGDLALLQISYAIIETKNWHRRIELYHEVPGQPIQQPSLIIIAGWQRTGGSQRRRATSVHILSNTRCQLHYTDHIRYEITENHICTTMPVGQRFLTVDDGGTALVFDGKLVGVLIFGGYNLPGGSRPDVFIRVNSENGYYNWIKSIIRPFLNPLDGSNLLPYHYTSQPQTMFYSAAQNNLFVHPHPAHFSHKRPNPPPPPLFHA